MRVSTSFAALTIAFATSLLVACGGETDPSGPNPGGSTTTVVSGIVRTPAGAVIQGASVTIGTATATTGADGRFEIQNVPVGSVTITITAPGFDPRSESVSVTAGGNAHDVVLTPQAPVGPQTLITHGNTVA